MKRALDFVGFLAQKGHTHKICYKSNMHNFGIIDFDELNSNIYKSIVWEYFIENKKKLASLWKIIATSLSRWWKI